MFNWFLKLFSTPDIYKIRYQEEKALSESLKAALTVCRDEKDGLQYQFNQTVVQLEIFNSVKETLNNKISELEKQFAYLTYEDNSATGLDKLEQLQKKIEEQETEIVTLSERLKNMSSLPDLKSLSVFVKSLKGSEGYNDPVLWYENLKSLFIVFGKPEIQNATIVPASEVEKKIKSVFPNVKFASSAKDGKYKLLTVEQARGIVEGSYTAIGKWVEDYFDCDKHAQNLRDFFAFYYLVNSCIEAWGMAPFGYHSWNLIICSDGILEVEPQNNQMTVLPERIGYDLQEIHDW